MKINMRLKRFLCLMLALVMVCTGFTITPKKVNAAVTNASASAVASYGLMEDVQDGVILHCWDWSFNNIKEQIPAIAAAGYTAVQTSPIQEAKESTKGKTNDAWWVFYQPKSFKIDNSGNSAFGTKAEFKAMCEEAHKYGVKVIVDVVANHLGNSSGYDLSAAIDADIRNDSSCWHDKWNEEINYGNRYSITHGSMGGLPDLNTESTKIQGYVLDYLKECIDAGADGFRFDAAKHISVKAEGSQYTFWENTLEKAKEYAKITRNIDLYAYGEILHDLGTNTIGMSDYTCYMSITENDTSNSIRNAVASGNAAGAATFSFSKGVPADKLVMWAESHDTYSNESKESTGVSSTNINKTWALVASRANASALYFARTNGYRAGALGSIGTWDWKDKEVAAVNNFHNYFHGESEYLSSSGSIAYNERGTTGVVLVNCGGTSTSVNVPANMMENGTYTDQITGNTFTVANGKITGNIGSTGIAVVYNKGPRPTISMAGGTFTTNKKALTIGLKNATSGTYKIGNGAATTYTSDTKIYIGSDMEVGDSVVVTLTATDGSKTTTRKYTFTKEEKYVPPYEYGVYFNNTAGWSKVNAYYWETGANGPVAWPGTAMTNLGNGLYGLKLDADFDMDNIIFNDGTNQTADLKFVMNGVYTPAGYDKPIVEEEEEEEEEEEPLIPPSNVIGFTFSGRTDSYIVLKWNKNAKATGYVIEQYKSSGWTVVETISDNSKVSFKVTDLKPSTNYKFRIKAYNKKDGEYVFSGYSSKTVKTLPSAVRDFSFSARRYNYITLKWSANSSAAGYQIQQYKNGAWTTIKTVTNKNTTSYKVTGLRASTTYKFRIRAYNSDSSKTLYGSFVEKSIKTLPSNITKFGLKARTDKSITLKWNKNASVDGYVIQQYKSGTWKTIKTVKGKNTTSYRITGLKASRTYYFRIKGYKMDGTKKLYGSHVSAKIKTLPSVVREFRVSSRGKYSINLKWNKNTSATGYVIEQYKGGKWVEVKRITKQSTTSCKIEGLKKSTSYKFRIKAYKASADKTKKWYGKTSAIAVKTLSK